MNDNLFFKPTPLYKEFVILDLIEKNSKITQRIMSQELGVAVSMVNGYLDEYESNGLIKRKYRSTKTVEYFVTKKGTEKKKVLNISYLNDSLNVFKSARKGILEFLNQIIDKGFKQILLYGAGEVAEIILQTLALESDISIEVVGVVDDDINKQNTFLVGFQIISVETIDTVMHDGILISSYTNRKIIKNKLIQRNYNKNDILNFFEI